MNEMVSRRINPVNEERRQRRQTKQKEKVHLRHQLRNNWSNNVPSPRKSTTLPWTDYSRMSKGMYLRKQDGALTRFKVLKIICNYGSKNVASHAASFAISSSVRDILSSSSIFGIRWDNVDCKFCSDFSRSSYISSFSM